MRKLSNWSGTIFCAVLTSITLVAQLFQQGNLILTAFVCFMPICFLFCEQQAFNVRRELDEMRRQLAAQSGATNGKSQ